MTREELRNWELSEYNEDTEDQLDYYLNARRCNVGDSAYLYDYAEDELSELKIVHIISWSDDVELYEELLEDDNVLIYGEEEYDADTSAEFITDDDSYLVWFKYV